MAVFFRSADNVVDLQVGEYQQFPEAQPKDAAAEPTPKPTKKLRHLSVVLLSFGLLCVIQAILNITLRLALRKPTAAVVTEAEDVCPEGWLTFDSSCYFISSQRRTWDGGRRDCLQKDADLVIIDSRQEQNFLTGFSAAAWVGMTDSEVEGLWIWVDGTRVRRDRLLWALGQPDDAFQGEDCGDLRTMINFIGLNDADCNERKQWICEKAL